MIRWAEHVALMGEMRNVAGCCEHGNETSGSIKGEEFLD
jgi:hypothetical protein